MTNREAHEEAAGMPLDIQFYKHNGIDPDAAYVEPEQTELDHADSTL